MISAPMHSLSVVRMLMIFTRHFSHRDRNERLADPAKTDTP